MTTQSLNREHQFEKPSFLIKGLQLLSLIVPAIFKVYANRINLSSKRQDSEGRQNLLKSWMDQIKVLWAFQKLKFVGMVQSAHVKLYRHMHSVISHINYFFKLYSYVCKYAIGSSGKCTRTVMLYRFLGMVTQRLTTRGKPLSFKLL